MQTGLGSCVVQESILEGGLPEKRVALCVCGLCLALACGGAAGREWSESAPSAQGRARVSLPVVGSVLARVVPAQHLGQAPGGRLKYGHACCELPALYTLWGGGSQIVTDHRGPSALIPVPSVTQ